jgi:LmbE family N-acetylglucosaminyl deacetylase
LRDGREPSLLIVTAHPDDETFGTGGTIALLARRGVPVDVALLTRGEAGEITDPELDTPVNRAAIGRLREAEARAAAEVLGVREMGFLGFRDGELPGLDRAVLTRAVVEAIRQHRPAVVVTFGPEGIYGHPDHIVTHETVTAAFRLAGEPLLAPGEAPPHRPARLFYHVLTSETAEEINARRGPVDLGGRAHPFVGYAPEQITTRVDATDVAGVKLAAMEAHRSQTAGRMDELRDRLATPLYEHYILAEPRGLDVPGLAVDLMAGLA